MLNINYSLPAVLCYQPSTVLSCCHIIFTFYQKCKHFSCGIKNGIGMSIFSWYCVEVLKSNIVTTLETSYSSVPAVILLIFQDQFAYTKNFNCFYTSIQTLTFIQWWKNLATKYLILLFL